MSRKIKDSVVVITGASSGIGRATALKLAEKKACVVLAARSKESLDSVSYECERLGGRVVSVVTDVCRAESVQDLAQTALERFGRIDVWINNAAVSLFARFEEAPEEVYKKVLDTNLYGAIHGSRAAIRCFREQGQGHLINMSSMVSQGGAPYISAYVVSKYGLNGLTMCLRQELLGTDIDVSLVLPGSIDTPLFQHAANYAGREVKPMDPVYTPEEVADAVLALIKKPKGLIYVGTAARAAATLNKASSMTYEKAMARMVERDHFRDRPAVSSDGNVFEPMVEWNSVHGGWPSKTSLTNGKLRKVARASFVLGVPGALIMASRAMGRRKPWYQRILST